VNVDSPDTSDRLQRERDFHNQPFTDDGRAAQEKYYFACSKGSALFDEQVRNLSRDADVLEYGCAKGDTSFDLAPVCRTLTGIDISDVAISAAGEQAAQLGLTNTRFLAMNAERMTFPDASFDLVFGRDIIHHLDVDRSLSEISRVLRPGGKALFWEPLGHNPIINGYRRTTPDARTADEHPLLRPDFDTVRKHFDGLDLTFYGLTTLATVPIRERFFGKRALDVTAALDRALFAIPGLRWWAWYSLIVLERPRIH